MCGRITLATDLEKIRKRFGFREGDELDFEPHYNLAPTQMLLAVNQYEGETHARMLRWGLIPFWAKDMSVGNRMINARAETLGEKPAFRKLLETRRCLVVADGFYEWKREGKLKIPMYVGLKGHEPFGLAGLWDSWRSPSGEKIRSCTIITTYANDLMRGIHDRMPVIIPRADESHWLDREFQDASEIIRMLEPYDPDAMEAWQVSPRVNSAANDSPECIQPVAQPRAIEQQFDFE